MLPNTGAHKEALKAMPQVRVRVAAYAGGCFALENEEKFSAGFESRLGRSRLRQQ